MIFKWGLTLIVVLSLTTPAAAEFYKYRDKNGAIRFTDNLAEVPADQREKLKIYEGSARAADRALPAASGQVAAQNGTASETAPEPAEKAAGEALIADLHRRQQALMEEYDALQKEREELTAAPGKRVSQAEQKKYNQQVDALNARLADYQKRRAAFEEEVAAHNEEMRQRLTPNPAGSSAP